MSAVIVPEVVTGVEPMVRVEFVDERPTDETVAFEVLHVAQEKFPPEPPICAPSVPEKVMGEVTPSDEVATLNTPAPPPDSRSCPAVRFEVVAIPVHVMFGVVPPEENKGADAVTDVTVPVGSAVLQFKSVPDEA